VPFLLGVLALAPAADLAIAALAGIASKLAADALLARRLRGRALRPADLACIPVKDVLIAGVWLVGAVRSTICWRGHRLRVGRGSRLSPVEETAPVPALQEVA
jgi:ceramide glucosyltransferase